MILYRQHTSNVVGAPNNGFKWISRIAKNTINLQQIRISKSGMIQKRKTLIELSQVICSNYKRIKCKSEDVDFARVFIRICEYNKLTRIAIYLKYKPFSLTLKDLWKVILL